MKLLEYFIRFHSTQIPLLYTIFAKHFIPQVDAAIVVYYGVVVYTDVKLSMKILCDRSYVYNDF